MIGQDKKQNNKVGYCCILRDFDLADECQAGAALEFVNCASACQVPYRDFQNFQNFFFEKSKIQK